MGSRIDNIKKYNQIILAIGGSVLVIILLVAGIALLTELISDIRRDNHNQPQGILAEDKTEQLLKDSLRQQIVTFYRFSTLDSLEQIYLMPVSHENLLELEGIGKVDFGISSRRSALKISSSASRIFNNLAVHYGKEKRTEILFKSRISIDEYLTYEYNGSKFLVISGAKSDSNKDNYLDSKDLQQLFIYDLTNRKLSEITTQYQFTTLNIYQPMLSNILIGHLGIDADKNGVFDDEKEMKQYFKINFDKLKLESFITENDLDFLQQLLEGSD